MPFASYASGPACTKAALHATDAMHRSNISLNAYEVWIKSFFAETTTCVGRWNITTDQAVV
jgi:hypothetical protein